MGRPSPPAESPYLPSPAPSANPRRSLPYPPVARGQPLPTQLGDGLDDLEDKGEGLPAYEAEPEGEDEPTDGVGEAEASGTGGVQMQEGEGVEHAGQSEENGGLARFGRWRGWVEKRALERFGEDNDRDARRAARRQSTPTLKLPSAPAPPSYDSTLPPAPPAPARYLPPAAHPTALPNSSLLRLDYGSNFIPHSNVSVNCALPILGGRLVVLGTSNGLRVLNTDDEENPTRCIWYGLPVWDLRIIQQSLEEPETQAPRGFIVVLCGGVEDSSKCSRPKKSSGTEVRIYNLSSLLSLARWAAIQPKSSAGLDLTPIKAGASKGKGKEVEWVMIDRTSLSLSGGSLRALGDALPTTTRPNGDSTTTSTMSRLDLPIAWSKDFSLLPSTPGHKSSSGGGQGDVLLLSTYTSQSRIFVAIGTSTHVVVYGTFPTEGRNGSEGIRFNASRTFYIPAPPTSLAFLQLPSNDLPPPSEMEMDDDTSSLFSYGDRVSIHTRDTSRSVTGSHSFSTSDTASTVGAGAGAGAGREAPPPHESQSGLPSLGMYVSFGSKACLIRVADSTVLDFKLRKSGVGNGKGDWGSLETLKLEGGGEVYVLTRGKETFLFSAPFEIPSHFNTPLAMVLWPESPSSLSASVDYTSTSSSTSSVHSSTSPESGEDVNVRLVATSFTGNLHVQRLTFSAVSARGKVRAKPFGSTGLGGMARIVYTHGKGKGVGAKEEGGCFVRYKKGERDWRVVKLERE